MATLEDQFEQAFTEITLPDGGQHLLEADAVTECVVNGDAVTITLDLPQDEATRQQVAGQVEARCKQIDGIARVTVRMADQAQPAPSPGPAPQGPPPGAQPRPPQRPQHETYLDNYDAVIAVGSGKGGVGKSTVAVNLAIALSQLGHKVSLFDADIYGPSVPIMMGLRNTKPRLNDDNSIVPLEKYGITLMSIGNLVEEAAATIWRGPIVHQVLDQMLRDTRWPGGEIMIIDLPPGTGDAQLTLTQLLELAGSVIVSTPQDVALLDAVKAVAMFQKVDVPILGLVENMSAFICPQCGTETPIFDKGNAQRAAGQNNIPFLGRIPIEMAVREGGDLGTPVTVSAPDSPTAVAFREIALRLLEQIERAD
ncbi:MAG TPA: Mrp/NBP35 family ATP-binding protein [bacterium]|nr:Mrp/NBP35 family ATP-binding protein [bacterium]